jgi:hypothetical protein
MNRSRTELQNLLSAARLGTPGAAGRLRSELEPELQHIVRRALRADPSASPLTRHIRTQARSVIESDWGAPISGRGSQTVGVAVAVADAVERRLVMGPGVREPLRETIRDRR